MGSNSKEVYNSLKPTGTNNIQNEANGKELNQYILNVSFYLSLPLLIIIERTCASLKTASRYAKSGPRILPRVYAVLKNSRDIPKPYEVRHL